MCKMWREIEGKYKKLYTFMAVLLTDSSFMGIHCLINKVFWLDN